MSFSTQAKIDQTNDYVLKTFARRLPAYDYARGTVLRCSETQANRWFAFITRRGAPKGRIIFAKCRWRDLARGHVLHAWRILDSMSLRRMPRVGEITREMTSSMGDLMRPIKYIYASGNDLNESAASSKPRTISPRRGSINLSLSILLFRNNPSAAFEVE